MRENIKFIFYIIPILGIIIKIIDDLFIETIKSKYSNIPGKMGAYSRTISFAGTLIIFIELIIAIIVLFFKRNSNIDASIDSSSNNSVYNFIGYIITLSLVINMILTVYLFYEIRDKFIRKLENNKYNLKNKVVKIKEYFKKNKTIKLLATINIALSYLNLVAWLIVLIVYYFIVKNHPDNLKESKSILATICIFFVFSITASVLSISLKKAFSEILQEKEYIFCCNNGEEYIKTKLYLDYKENYLVIKEDYEIWLSKSNVKRKIVKSKK